MVRVAMDAMCCKSVGTDLSMLDIDDFNTEISQLKKKVALLETKLRSRGDKGLNREDSELSLTLLGYTESKPTDAQDTTVCDSNQSSQDDQTSTESLDSVCNAGEQQQILQTTLKMCSVKLIDCRNLMMKMRRETTDEEHHTEEDEDSHDDEDFIPSVLMMRDEMDAMCCKSVGTDLSMLDIDDFITEISQLKKKVALLETKLRLRGDEGLNREDVDVVCCESSTQDSELSLTSLGYVESKPTDAQDTTVCDSNQSSQDDQTSPESLDSVCNAGEQQQILQTTLKMCSVKLIDCRNLMMKMRRETTEEEHHTEEDEDSHDDEDFIPSDENSDSCCDEETPSTSKERLAAQTLSCTRSKISCTTLQAKKLHLEEHREKKKKKTFHCKQCGKVCVSYSSLNVHMRTHSGEKPYYCTECGNDFRTKEALNVHQRIHTGEKPHRCSVCGKSFSQHGNLVRHQRTHTGEKPYYCTECGNDFRTKQDLKVHQRIHTGEKPYECPHCEKRFRQKSYLKTHILLHTNEKPYQCSQCGKTFRDSRSLKLHQIIHSEEKLHQCSQCDKRFGCRSYLKIHERVHTGVKPYYCSVCGKNFSRRDHLGRHQRTHTGEKLSVAHASTEGHSDDRSSHHFLALWQNRDLLVLMVRVEMDAMCCKSVGTDLSMLDIDDFNTEISQLKKKVALLETKLRSRGDKGLNREDSELSLTSLGYVESKPTDAQDTTVCDSNQSLQDDQTSTESLDSVCNAGEQQQILQTTLKMCSVKLIDCRNLMMKMRRETTDEEHHTEEDEDSHDDEDFIPSVLMMRDEMDEMFCKSVGTDLSMLDIDDFITEISQLKKKVALLETKLRLRGDKGLNREDVDVVCCESSTQDSELSLTLLGYVESKPTDAQDTTVCDSNQSSQDDQTSSESLDSVCNAGEQQQILQTTLKMCSVKLIDCRNLMMKMRRETTEEEQHTDEDEDSHDDEDFIPSVLMMRDEMDEMFCKSVGTDLSMLDIDDFITEISQLKKKVALLETKLRLRRDTGLNREDSELSLTSLGYVESKPTDAQDTTVCDSNQSSQDDQTSTESLDSVCNAGEQQQILQTTLKMCSVKLIDCRNLMMKMRRETTEEEQHTDEDEDSHDDEDFIPSDENSDSSCDDETPSTSKERLAAQTLSCTRSKISCTTLQAKKLHSEEHREKKKKKKTFHCKQCGKGCVSYSSLNVHMRTHRGEKPYYCTECGNDFRTKQALNVHQRIHTGKKPHRCSVCGKSFSQHGNLVRHQRTHTGEKPHRCSVCGKSFSRRDLLVKHQRTHTGEKPYYCTECGNDFRTKQDLKVHQRIHTGEKPYECPHCEKRFRQKSYLKTHILLHTNEKPYQCSQCGKTFRDSRSLKLHQIIHSEEKLHQCSQCDKRFGCRSYLKIHERVHNGVKPHYCSVCGKNFSQRDHLGRHQRTHTGEKPHRCSVCGKSFSQHGTLVRHQRTHTGEKPHHCSVCGNSFSQRHHLVSHQRTHTGEKLSVAHASTEGHSDDRSSHHFLALWQNRDLLVLMVRVEMDEMFCKSVGTDLSMLDIDDFITEISQLKKKVALLETKLRLRGDEGLNREDVDVVCCESSTQDSELSLTLLGYVESKPTDAQDTTVCDSNQSLQDDQTSTESLDSVCNAGEQQQILQTTLKICSVKLIDCRNLMMKMRRETTDEEHHTDEDEDSHDDEDFIPSVLMMRDEMDAMCCKSVGTDLSMLDIDDFITEIKDKGLNREDVDVVCCESSTQDSELSLTLLGYTESKPTETQDTTVCDSNRGLEDDSVCNAGEQQQILQTTLKMCSVKLIDCRNLMMKMRRETTEEEQHTDEDEDSHDDEDFIPSDENSDSSCDEETPSTSKERLAAQTLSCTRSKISCTSLQAKKLYSEEHREKKKKRKFHCKRCGKVCVSSSSLNVHMRTHSGEKPYYCTECGNDFSAKEALNVHQRIHTGEKPHRCSVCGKSFSQHGNLVRHQRTHTGKKPHRCSVCGKRLSRRDHLVTHQRTHTGEKPHCCSVCGKSFSRRDLLVKHQRTHTGEKPYYCTECGNDFRTKPALKVHQRIHTGEKPYECPHCEKRFSRTHILKGHVFIHTNEKPYQCSQCGKTFRQLSTLKLHQIIHSEEKIHQCSQCDKCFGCRSYLKIHERVHNGVKPHYCSVCGKNFSRRDHLGRHQRTHTGEKPHRCSVCGKSFSQHGTLVRHQRTHTGEKPHRCSVCGNSFSQRHHLVSHQRTHTGGKLSV
ncbi:uncharacterized protein [Misgurnus anguillicaudatus]|uniref:uncharacterized protein n=1 Tax=Misgurnus anguillicaudatus TaxID=75329 RepID=UPI003CCFA72F